MTIVYKGIHRKTTDVLDDYGQAQYLQNVRLRRVGELGRRAGLGKSTMARLDGPVQFMIGAWSNVPFIVNGTGGDVTGNAEPLLWWIGGTLPIPDGHSCARYSVSTSGTVSDVGDFPPLPRRACAGTVTVTGMESGGCRGADYGYQFTISADGVAILTSGCLVNDSAFAAIPAGASLIQFLVMGGCSSPGAPVGSWQISLSAP